VNNTQQKSCGNISNNLLYTDTLLFLM